MCLFRFMCAIITRALFLILSLSSIWRVMSVKKDLNYWLLTILFLPLLVEMIITLKSRKGKDYKWFSPAIFLFIISVIPSIWILELHDKQDNCGVSRCKDLNSGENDRNVITQNVNRGNGTYQNDFEIRALHQLLLLLIIVGKWLLPLGGGVTRDELSQLLLIFVSTAADNLEFTSETMADVKQNSPQMIYIMLAVWTWSMLQFPLHLAVVNSKPDGDGEQGAQEVSLLSKHSTDIWSIVAALFIQDGPFLVVRLIVMTYFGNIHEMLVFFTLKNFLVVTLNLYRLVVICQDSRSRAGRGSAVPCV